MNDATPAHWASLAASLPTGTTPLTDSDAQVAPYADDYYTYDGQGRISSLRAQGQGCSSCSGGLGTATFSCASSSGPIGQNAWPSKIIETLPDGAITVDRWAHDTGRVHDGGQN